MSVPIAQFSTPPSPPHRGFPPLVSIPLFSTSVSQLLPCTLKIFLSHFPKYDYDLSGCVFLSVFNCFLELIVFCLLTSLERCQSFLQIFFQPCILFTSFSETVVKSMLDLFFLSCRFLSPSSFFFFN